jgi:hypothetical protein
LIFADLQDGAIPATGEPVSDLLQLLENKWGELAFDLALLHWPKDWHVDHENAARIGRRLARHVRSVLYFESWSSIDYRGSLCLDVTRFWDERMQMIDLLTVHPQPQATARVEVRALYHGDTIRVKTDPIAPKYAESFASARFDLSTLASCFLNSH